MNINYIKTPWRTAAALLLLGTASLMADAGVRHALSFDVSALSVETVTMPDGEDYAELTWPGMSYAGEPGTPALPVRTVKVKVPPLSRNFRVSVISRDDTLTNILDEWVSPIRRDVPINEAGTDDGFSAPSEEAYSTIHDAGARITGDYFLEGCIHLVNVSLSPVSYDPATGAVTACREMEIEIEWDDCLASDMETPPVEGAVPSGMIDLGDVIDCTQPSAAAGSIARAGSLEPLTNMPSYYIITDRSLVSAFNRLAVWKQLKGYMVKVVAIQDILANSKYKVNESTAIVDAAAALRAYLKDEYNTYKANGAFFCLIAGDTETTMPYRMTWLYSNTPGISTDFENIYIPTDNYFGDLTSAWNLVKDGNGIYGTYYKNLTYNPLIYVGRLLCKTTTEVRNYIDKLILYESNPGKGAMDYLSNSLYYFQNSFDDQLTAIRDEIPLFNKRSVFDFNQDYFFVDAKMNDLNAEFYPSGETIINKMNDCGFATWFGHGNPGSVGVSGEGDGDAKIWQCITPLDYYGYNECFIYDKPNNGLDKLSNSSKPGVVYSMSCTIMPFDNIYNIPYNLGSAYTVAGKYGGVALIGNTRKGLKRSSTELQVEFMKEVLDSRKIGIAETLSKASYFNKSSLNKYAPTTNNLIGDPEFEMWLNTPLTLNAAISSETENGVTLNGVSGSKVFVTNGASGKLYTPTTNSLSSTLSAAPANMKGIKVVSIWKTGYLPHIVFSAHDGTLKNQELTFNTTIALLGYQLKGQKGSTPFTIQSGGVLNLEVSGITRISDNFQILNGGKLNLKCDNVVTNGTIKQGAEVSIQSDSIEFEEGFNVELGASFSYN